MVHGAPQSFNYEQFYLYDAWARLGLTVFFFHITPCPFELKALYLPETTLLGLELTHLIETLTNKMFPNQLKRSHIPVPATQLDNLNV